ncbi:uncharacterized protein LOC107643138 [Arachis ipaensis]|uniref:uncharacterized protein LOC107643138 n=1 Tax=Arachis ipaensis TaxID=130454 RepID=UPI000A2B6EE6|nr:uncharacterized protein LOC107643138 [Arachis ipaensis]
MAKKGFVVAPPFSYFSIRYRGGDGGRCKQVVYLEHLEDSPVSFSLLRLVKSMVVDTGEEAIVVVLATTAVAWVTWPRRRSRSSGACYSCGGDEPYGQGLQPRRTQMWRHARRWWWQWIR